MLDGYKSQIQIHGVFRFVRWKTLSTKRLWMGKCWSYAEVLYNKLVESQQVDYCILIKGAARSLSNGVFLEELAPSALNLIGSIITVPIKGNAQWQWGVSWSTTANRYRDKRLVTFAWVWGKTRIVNKKSESVCLQHHEMKNNTADRIT